MDRTKIYISVAIIAFATLATALIGGGASAFADGDDGLIIDFGDYNAVWTAVDLDEYPDAMSSLGYACSVQGFALRTSAGKVSSIGGVPGSASEGSWSLWAVPKGKLDWNRIDSDPSSVTVSNYSAVTWSLCAADGKPSVPGVDQTGVNYWGYKDIGKVVTLAPSVTETVCAMGGSDMVIGADEYSKYPDSIAKKRASGQIKVTGGYTNPNFETILKLDPDMVLCDGSQASHRIVASKLRNVGVNVLVFYGGEDLGTLYDNIYMTGTALDYNESKMTVINEIRDGIDRVVAELDGKVKTPLDLMFSLSSAKSPWVAGGNTYINDIAGTVFGVNVFKGLKGWTMVNSEMIVKASPDVIIVVSEGLRATEEDYLRLIEYVSEGWDYINAEIYMICGTAVDLVSRPGPRLAQVTELISRILYDPMFGESTGLPHYIGDNYEDYLTLTKTLGYNN
jgi:iron complex transport system substrate-binding protein